MSRFPPTGYLHQRGKLGNPAMEGSESACSLTLLEAEGQRLKFRIKVQRVEVKGCFEDPSLGNLVGCLPF